MLSADTNKSLREDNGQLKRQIATTLDIDVGLYRNIERTESHAKTDKVISKATEYNWNRLNSDMNNKLTKRANKTLSQKCVVASNYLDYPLANILLERISPIDANVGDIMFTLCLHLIKYSRIIGKENVKKFISTLNYKAVTLDVPEKLWDTDEDVLGFIYQSIIPEGERNLTGQYYTNKKVAEYMLNGKILNDGETFLDPCCGSGAFLLAVKTNTPECLYGFDINPIAVMIASTNLLVKFANYDFIPNIYCIDYLKKDLFTSNTRNDIPLTFNNIYTNPPWGADKQSLYTNSFSSIKSKERASMVVAESIKRLSNDGFLYFLLPTSLLKIKTHNDIRKIILNNTTIHRIDLFKDRFDGVFTDYFSIKISNNKTDKQEYDVTIGNTIERIILSEEDKKEGNIVIEQLSELDTKIIYKMESLRHDDLKHSKWALGIVTGDNKGTVKKVKDNGMEPVFAGKQVEPFRLKQETTYINFSPDSFQQCAKEEIYRAPEKLIYRFIAKYPIVAYDDKQCLCLNSANILIPELDGISIKSTAALLNSTLYHYYYSIKYTDIKVLKGNLQELPFPKLTKSQNYELSELVSLIQKTYYSSEYQKKLDDVVYSIFNITPEEQQQIQLRVK